MADCAYDSHGFRSFLARRGTKAVEPNNKTRKHPYPLDRDAYRRRNLIERMFSRLKAFRRVATRDDKLAVVYDAAVAIAALVIWWL
jgi:transposase